MLSFSSAPAIEKPGNWTSAATFTQDCENLVSHYKPTSPFTRVWLNLVPPALPARVARSTEP